MEPNLPTISAEAISKRFGATQALSGVTLRIGAGETHALVGRNGAGKSTLVGVLTGLVKPDDGQVRFGRDPAPPLRDRDAWRSRIACVYQRSQVIPHLSVAENLFLGRLPMRGGRVSWRTLYQEAERVLSEWRLELSPTTEAGRLDVADLKLLEIARALSAGTRALILDEPTAELDNAARRRLYGHLERLGAAGVTLLYISHHLNEVFDLCDRVTVLRNGRAVLTAKEVADLTHRELVAAMTGERTASRSRPAGQAPGNGSAPRKELSAETPVVLDIQQLSVGGRVHEVSLQVRAGECVGLMGLHGAGRSELAACIAGLAPAESGVITIGGERLRPGVRQAQAAGIGYLPPDRHREGFVPALSVAENITMTLRGDLGPGGWINRERRTRIAADLAEGFQVTASSLDQPVGELSGGNQQKTVLARAMAARPRLLVLAHPTVGVDTASKEVLSRLIREAREDGMAILLITDDEDELALCQRTLVMFRGRVVREFIDQPESGELTAAIEGIAA